jgi:hypothetical protein
MHALKIINAKSVHKYIDAELKLLNGNCNIYFDKILLEKKLSSKYPRMHREK